MESDIGYQSFQYVKFKHFIRNNPSVEIAKLGLSINKLFPCFYCCKRLYYICIIISLTLVVGMVSVFVLSFYCIGRSNMNMPSMVADMTLQYINERVNWITTRHANRINSEKLKTSVVSDYRTRMRLIWLQHFFHHEEVKYLYSNKNLLTLNIIITEINNIILFFKIDYVNANFKYVFQFLYHIENL